jgi:hypothetical protein
LITRLHTTLVNKKLSLNLTAFRLALIDNDTLSHHKVCDVIEQDNTNPLMYQYFKDGFPGINFLTVYYISVIILFKHEKEISK